MLAGSTSSSFAGQIRTGSSLPQNAHIDCSFWTHGQYLTLQRKDGLASMFLTEIAVQDEMTAAIGFGIGIDYRMYKTKKNLVTFSHFH